MQFLEQGERVQLRFLSGESFVAPTLAWLKREGIGYATMTGLGAVSGATVSYWNSQTKQYEQHELAEQMEVVSLVGNVTLREGQPFVHAHVSLGRQDLSLIGGHMNDLSVHPTLEIWLRPELTAVERTLDESCGLFVMQLPNEA
jgi:predicted DNA-binding protein with PD1-like motif